jgi:hypothetical protein
MFRGTLSALIAASILLCSPAQAAVQTITATVTLVIVNSTLNSTPMETVDFKLPSMPGSTGCTGTGYFEFNAASVTDANTRKNMVAALYAARASGLTVSVVYDDSGRFCSTYGYAVPVAIEF